MALKSLLLITIDCLRADHTAFLGGPRAVTPSLDRLAARGLVLENAIVGGTPTYNSFPVLMAGRFPLSLGRDLVGLAPGELTLASFLRSRGFRTGAVVAGNPYVSRHMGYGQGFEVFEDHLQPPGREPERPPRRLRRRLRRGLERRVRRLPLLPALYDELYFWYGWWRTLRQSGGDVSFQLARFPRAGAIVDRAVDLLAELRRDGRLFFLWLHLMDAHRPYFPPPASLAAVGRPDLSERRMLLLRNLWLRPEISLRRLARHRRDFLDLYDASIHSADAEVGRLVEHLERSALMDRLVVAVTSDHGEAFLERGERDHDPVLLTQEIVRVPLLIRCPEIAQALRQRSVFSQLDLAPTLVRAVGCAPPAGFRGLDRWPDLLAGRSWEATALTEVGYGHDVAVKGRFVAPRRRLLAVQDRRYKLVVSFAHPSFELFDLGRDPGEENPLTVAARPRAAARLLRAAAAHLHSARAERLSRPELLLRLEKARQALAHRSVAAGLRSRFSG